MDTDKPPHALHLTIKAEPDSQYACPVYGKACSTHGLQEKTCRHLKESLINQRLLNFFQQHCYVHTRTMFYLVASPGG